MYALLIIDAIGNVREWTRGTLRRVKALVASLPANGWSMYGIVDVS